MAEARAAVHEPKVRYHEEGTSEIEQETKVAKSFFQDLKICAFRTRRQIYNGLWPTTWDNLLAALAVVFLMMYIDHPKLNVISKYFWLVGDYMYLDDSYPYFFRLFMISLISSIVYFIVILYTRQYILRFLLAYKGWLYQPPRSQSIIVIIWALIVRVVSGRHPRLYAYQNSLPRMNVPPLKSTVKKFMESVKPVLGREEYEEMEKNSKEFLSTIGPKLQWILQLKSWWAPNYCTDWWEKYVYLMGRDPISINSNYYCLDQGNWVPTPIQTSRAAGITCLMLIFKNLLDTEKLDPLVIRKTIPLCMWQYQRMFGTARVPRTDQDKIKHCPGSEHIVVLSKGHFYKLYVVDAHGKKLNVLDLQGQYEWILKDAETQTTSTEAECRIPALTGSERNSWARVRREHFTSGINKNSLQAIEEALFLVVLDENECTDMSTRGKHLMHGDGASLWFDKTMNVVVFKDGRMGMNCEHAWADAPVIGHLMEYVLTHEYLYRMYDDQGNCKPFLSTDTKQVFKRSNAVITPMRLYWDVNKELAKSIDEAYKFSIKNNNDLSLAVRKHDLFGKGFIKTTKMSPDAYIQMALQLAYYKDSEQSFALTYESSMTRLFLQGRTETVRSLTENVKEFVIAMNDVNVSAKEKYRLMQAAASRHQRLYRDAMSGKGIDRHLFSLYIVCRGQGYESPFLKGALTLPWTLSTSQQPQQQMDRGFDLNIPEVQDTLSPGGGFGPVSDTGYGVSYMIPDEELIYFHVSSKKSAKNTDSQRFVENIFWALSEMKRVALEAKR
ncbi:carnitine O-palmitoyltransferase 1, liver isoform-like [Hydractinia symbiolongicarpus]|uniref:carnitine O-palmitoyltransferase 1, liver isoform-like n=1 Tax=Hydractinia symbiolongicarpus TaxID=13093 RepID=UPI0025514EE4|nr:carnitine O-palmitoyltransferase 1, liver isoform-like [Hydractinia symbiolongicarpus]